MKLLHKSLFIVAPFFALILLILSNIFLWRETERNNYSINDITGNRACLKDITVSGRISDDMFKSDFTIKDNIVTSNFEAYNSDDAFQYYLEGDEYYNFNCKVNYKPSADAKFRDKKANSEETKDKEIVRDVYVDKADISYDISEQNVALSLLLGTQLQLVSDSFDIDFTYYKLNGKEEIMGFGSESDDTAGAINHDRIIRTNKETGKIYAYTLTGKNFRGTGGAYDITKHRSSKDSDKPERLKLIAPIDLKDGNVRIIGMETTGNILLFITIKNHDIYIMPFDTTTNQFLEEIPLHCSNFDLDQYRYGYSGEAENSYISLLLPLSKKGDQDKVATKIVIYDAKMNRLITNYNSDLNLQSDWNESIKYKNNKLYVLHKSASEKNSKYEGYGVSEAFMNKLLLSVFDQKEMIYQGEVVSDINDDFLFMGDPRVDDRKGLVWRSYYRLDLE